MEEIKLDVQIRNTVGSRKIKAIRRNDLVPAVVYGGEQKDSTLIQVDRRSYEQIMRHHRGQSVLFHLNVLEGEKKLRDYSVILKEEQHNPVSDALIHIDFLRISLTEEIEVKVPVVAKGEPIGVKKDGGSLDQPLHDLDVICLPTSIPEKIIIDVSNLNIHDAIHVKDIVLPAGVKTEHDPDSIVFSVVPPMKEEAPEEAEEAATEPEVIGKKKEKGEEGEAADAKAKDAKAEDKK